jgi:hypothetical protein
MFRWNARRIDGSKEDLDWNGSIMYKYYGGGTLSFNLAEVRDQRWALLNTVMNNLFL